MSILKKIFYKYQKAMFYLQQAGNEISKPLRFYSEFALLLLLIDRFGIKLKIWQIVISYILIIIIAILIGRVLTKIGVVKYNNHLANKQNEMLQEILNKIKGKKSEI